MAASNVIKFRAKPELASTLKKIHGELGKGEFSDTLRYLLVLGVDVHSKRFAWLEQVKEEGRKRGIVLHESE